MVSFSIGSLLHKPVGTKHSVPLDEIFQCPDPDDPRLICNVTGTVNFLKLPHEINVQIKNLHTAVECVCRLCLTRFEYTIDVPFAEREFIIDLPPEAIEKGEDVQYVSKNNAILLDEMIREEILLHFEEFPVCSGGCKGLCHTCGANRNEKKCSCSTAALKPHSPFRFL